MTKHSQGSWKYRKSDFTVRTQGNFVICNLLPFDRHGDERDANAQLIASAPEMLEALKKVREHVMILGGLPMDIHNKVCNAIEKAGGNEDE